jgi:hypothetical protein
MVVFYFLSLYNISSYRHVVKTVIFWLSEELEQNVWTPNNLLNCFMMCLKRLIYWITYGYLPNYFSTENDILHSSGLSFCESDLLPIGTNKTPPRTILCINESGGHPQNRGLSIHCLAVEGHSIYFRLKARSTVPNASDRHGPFITSLVPIGSKSDSQKDNPLEWRISFSVPEKMLIYSWNHSQIIDKNDPSSYIIINSLFHSRISYIRSNVKPGIALSKSKTKLCFVLKS